MIKIKVDNGRISDSDRKKLKEEYTIDFIPYDKTKQILAKVKESLSKEFELHTKPNTITINPVTKTDDDTELDKLDTLQYKITGDIESKIGSLIGADTEYEYEFDGGTRTFFMKNDTLLNLHINNDINESKITLKMFFRYNDHDTEVYFEDRDGESLTEFNNHPDTKDGIFSKTKHKDYIFGDDKMSNEQLINNLAFNYNTALSKIPDLHMRAKSNPSNEEFGVYISGIASFFTNKVETVSLAFTNSYTQLFGITSNDENFNIKEIVSLYKEVLYIKANIKMGEIEKIQTPILMGMKLSLPDILSKIKIGFDLIDKELLPMLKEVDEVVSKVMTSKDFRIQTRPLTSKYDSWNIERDLYKLIDDMIDQNGVKDRTDLSNVIPNIVSFETCYNDIMKLATLASVRKLEEIQTLTKTISEKTHTLHTQMSDNKDMEISRQILEYLGYRLEESAKAVTSSITMIYIYNQSIDVFRNAVVLTSKLAK